MRAALLLMACAGCDQVLGLSELPPSAPASSYDRCAPGGADEPLRYRTIPLSFAGSHSWQDARTMCRVRGLDLAVINDVHELAVAAEGSGIWFGATRDDGENWESIDGCPAPAMLASPETARCGAIYQASTVGGAACDGTAVLDPIDPGPQLIQSALCETPRPETAACLPAASKDETYAVSPEPLTNQAARAFCKQLGLHLIVLSSSDEKPLLELVSAPAWIGATFDGAQWHSETGCPGLYLWTDSGPVFDDNHTCAATAFAPDPETGTTRMIGMQTAQCSELRYAICESD